MRLITLPMGNIIPVATQPLPGRNLLWRIARDDVIRQLAKCASVQTVPNDSAKTQHTSASLRNGPHSPSLKSSFSPQHHVTAHPFPIQAHSRQTTTCQKAARHHLRGPGRPTTRSRRHTPPTRTRAGPVPGQLQRRTFGGRTSQQRQRPGRHGDGRSPAGSTTHMAHGTGGHTEVYEACGQQHTGGWHTGKRAGGSRTKGWRPPSELPPRPER